ncbi:hypothetical protein QE152_g12695 [Popillia japonica]|uniref:C2H2-type domain-containing protein n=1 Tax=Popillia japonica TaxID=7064 RepID=A0AAW1LID5_POPJA
MALDNGTVLYQVGNRRLAANNINDGGRTKAVIRGKIRCIIRDIIGTTTTPKRTLCKKRIEEASEIKQHQSEEDSRSSDTSRADVWNDDREKNISPRAARLILRQKRKEAASRIHNHPVKEEIFSIENNVLKLEDKSFWFCICTVCHQCFDTKELLERHKMEIHNHASGNEEIMCKNSDPPKKQCHICKKIYFSQRTLTKHLQTHNQDSMNRKSYFCQNEVCVRYLLVVGGKSQIRQS